MGRARVGHRHAVGSKAGSVRHRKGAPRWWLNPRATTDLARDAGCQVVRIRSSQIYGIAIAIRRPDELKEFAVKLSTNRGTGGGAVGGWPFFV